MTTPRPWKFKRTLPLSVPNPLQSIIGSDGQVIGEICTPYTEANAALIVAAVNERDGLLANEKRLTQVNVSAQAIIEGLLADIEFLGTAQKESAIAGDKLQQQADALRAGISNALQIVVYSDSKTVPQVISEMVDILQAALAQAGGGK